MYKLLPTLTNHQRILTLNSLSTAEIILMGELLSMAHARIAVVCWPCSCGLLSLL